MGNKNKGTPNSILLPVTAIDSGYNPPQCVTFYFEVYDPDLDIVAAAKAAATEWCQTEEGKRDYIGNCHCFNWGDFDSLVPNDLCLKRGFSKVNPCAYGVTVNFDEQLVDEESVFSDEEEEE